MCAFVVIISVILYVLHRFYVYCCHWQYHDRLQKDLDGPDLTPSRPSPQRNAVYLFNLQINIIFILKESVKDLSPKRDKNNWYYYSQGCVHTLKNCYFFFINIFEVKRTWSMLLCFANLFLFLCVYYMVNLVLCCIYPFPLSSLCSFELVVCEV